MRVKASPVNPVDLVFVAGFFGPAKLPAIPGYEGAGIVERRICRDKREGRAASAFPGIWGGMGGI